MKKIIYLTAALFLAGCGVWEDFTTYFNLYYNTKDLFEQVEKSIQDQKKGLFEIDHSLSAPAGSNQQLIKVIEKASKLLQFHNESSFVDDALLMLGKSFFYQKNYQKGLRKFQELLATQPESDLILETRLWIGKTEMRLRNYENGLKVLQDVKSIAKEEDEEEILIKAYVEEISYYLEEEDYTTAISLCDELLGVSDDDEINAEVAYELGRLYVLTEDMENAIATFQKVNDYSPTYEIYLDAQLELGRAYREAGYNEKALEVFEDLREDEKFTEYYDIMDLEIGKTLAALERYDEALEQLAIVDTTYKNLPTAGEAKFRIGEIYENQLKNFDSAKVYYAKAAAAQAPPEVMKSARERNQLFIKYTTITDKINKNEKQLFYAEFPEEFVKDSIAFYADTLDSADTDLTDLEEETETNEEEFRPQRSRTRDFDTKAPIAPNATAQTEEEKKEPPIRPAIPPDSIKSIIAADEFQLGNLFFTEFDLPDSAYYYYNHILELAPETEYKARTLYGIASYYSTVGKQTEADSIYNYIYQNFRNESIVNAAADKLGKPLIDLDYDPAEEHYENAEKQMMDKNYSASVDSFYTLSVQYPESDYAPRALFASGFLLENELNLYDSAAALYDSVITKYPQSVYASRIREKVNVFKAHRKAVEDSLRALRIQDSIAVADSLSKLNQTNIKADSTVFDSTNVTIPPADTIKNIYPEERTEPEKVMSPVDSLTVPVDSLENTHELRMDSIRRIENRALDSAKEKLEVIDSLQVEKPEKKDP